MPKSKRAKIVHLTKAKKKGRQRGDALIEEIRDSVDEFSNIFLFEVENMRNAALKDLRIQWKDSRFFIGRNKLMIVALGKDEEDEFRTGLSELANRVSGNCGLLFSNRDAKEVCRYFKDYKVPQFAKSGCSAPRKYTLSPRVLEGLPVSMEPQLRALGLPVRIKTGKLEIAVETTVCQEGAKLTPEQCKILEMFEEKMVNFRVKILGCYSEEKYTHFGGVSSDTKSSMRED
mmetsp:Transcript_5460/g.13302  ORF Transcript_5460/g.13302 Transcript_5460/m.13302 type:complete len:231 (-) Transcript_5460:214-906(-)|eukprot:CAMPEP_0114523106 /NCGR_PEP_ID=MMETSP0109-20121206/21110_1 /TAXON_ID=29199 /ORGANISM="Chlorarachnion reptans, Strain CCCM449" /LENGTH=230 /DNA_ID=CAMNT_0001704391 /DNA_START=122 /DNA_END=814 /DNA_ORIENTATION=-